ncbi:MAG: hypothetical protein ACRDUA_03385, partial [Micromonosporaceae bacterium]
MDRSEATKALQDTQRRTEAVRAGARWPVTVLTVWGVITFGTEAATAYLAPSLWAVAPLGVVLLFVAWLAVYATRQRATSRGFAKRYVAVVVTWGVLHGAYLQFLLVVKPDLPYALAGSLLVAAPL